MQAVGKSSAARLDELNSLFFTGFPFQCEGYGVATLASPVSSSRGAPASVAAGLIGRVVRSTEQYGVIPREV
jgi:hypothetical protein